MIATAPTTISVPIRRVRLETPNLEIAVEIEREMDLEETSTMIGSTFSGGRAGG
jgi:hypothetical protein